MLKKTDHDIIAEAILSHVAEARYQRGSFESTLNAAKKSAAAHQKPMFIYPTYNGFTIDKDESNARMGDAYVKVHPDGNHERWERELGQREFKIVNKPK